MSITPNVGLDDPVANFQLTAGFMRRAMGDANMLLLSNGANKGEEKLGYARDWVLKHFRGAQNFFYIPNAYIANDAYGRDMAEVLGNMGFACSGRRKTQDDAAALQEADAIFISGGQTYHLMNNLRQQGLWDIIQNKIRQGVPYMGSSAGSIITCPAPTRTGNDWSVEPLISDLGFGTFPVQMNPHFEDNHLDPNLAKETAEDRTREFHILYPNMPVLGLREGPAFRVSGGCIHKLGPDTTRVMQAGREAREIPANVEIIADLIAPS